MSGDGGRIDYEYELGNGWNEYQKLVLAELKRLADESDKVTTLLQAHEIHFAALTEQNKQRDQVLEKLVEQLTDLRDKHDDLRDDHDALADSREHGVAKVRLSMKIVGLAIGALAWCATTGLSVYAVFFHSAAPPR